MKTTKHLIAALLIFTFSSVIYAQAPRFAPSKLVIRFDDAPQEITWELKNKNGTVFQTGGPFDSRFANKVITFEFTTSFGISPLQFTIRDSAGNGLSGDGAWAINTENLARITSRPVSEAVGNRIVNGNRDFGSETTITFDPTARTTDLGELGNVSVNDIFLIETVEDGFYQIQDNSFVRVNITNIPSDDDGGGNDDDDDDQTQAIEDVLNLRVVNRFARRLSVIIDSDISDQTNIRLTNGNGNTIRDFNRSINQGRNRINITNLSRGLYFLILETNTTTGNITKRVFVR